MADEGYETSTAASMKGVKPHIPKGYYALQFLGFKEFKDDKGEWIEDKFGRKVILDFAVHHIKRSHDESGAPVGDGEVGGPVTIKQDNVIREVQLSKFVHVFYKDTEKTGKPKLDKEGKQTYKTAITPEGRITRIFKSLGWKGPEVGKKLLFSEYVGNWCEGNINDYEIKEAGVLTGKKASGIEEIGPLAALVPIDMVSHQPTRQEVKKVVVMEEPIIAKEEDI